jgi:hypothetical protein
MTAAYISWYFLLFYYVFRVSLIITVVFRSVYLSTSFPMSRSNHGMMFCGQWRVVAASGVLYTSCVRNHDLKVH